MAKLIDFNKIEGDMILFENTSFQSYGYGIVSQLITKDRTISIQAKGVYSYLVSCAGNDNQTYPSQETMCYDLSIKDKKTLRKYIKELQLKGYIKIVKTMRDNIKYKNVYLIATDTRSQEIWKREFEQGKEIEEAEIITENKKSLTYGEVKDNKKSKNFNVDNSIPQNIENDNNNFMENENKNEIDYQAIAYAKCLSEIEGFEQMEQFVKDFHVHVMLRKISIGDN